MPGLLAKPTVDILLEISGETTLGELRMSLEEAGYLFAAQPGKPAPGMMFMKGDTPEGFAREALKRPLQVKYTHDRDAYTKAKGSFIKSTTALARKHFGAKYRPGAAQGRQLG